MVQDNVVFFNYNKIKFYLIRLIYQSFLIKILNYIYMGPPPVKFVILEDQTAIYNVEYEILTRNNGDIKLIR